jgi:energy-coupling factor transporter ATP-binding protein EcfA2
LESEILKIDGLSFNYPGASMPALSEISCKIKAGECICLTGNSGCGKTTMLLAIMGLLRDGTLTGTLQFSLPPVDDRWSRAAGIVFQNAESQIICSTVAEEVAFGPENLCVPPQEIARRVRKALRSVGLDGLETRNVERFSAGQKQRLTIASVLSMNPNLLLLDEPTSQLDVQGKLELFAILDDLKQQGYTLIMAEHDPRSFSGLIDRYLVLEQGHLVETCSTLPNPGQYQPRTLPPVAVRLEDAAPVIEVQGLTLCYPETGEVLKQLDMRLLRGERVHLFGNNGAGKSSLLRCLAGLERPGSGRITLAGIDMPRPETLPGKVGVLFQNPARQLFAESVQEEVAFTLERLGYAPGETGQIVAEALALCGISHLAARAPLILSFGEQHRVALAAVVAPRPELLLLDEPFAGLDFPQRLALLAILAEMPAKYGTTVLIASHDELPDLRWADRNFFLKEGYLAEIT